MPTLQEILKSKIRKDGKLKAYVASELKVGEKTIENYMNGVRQPKPNRLIQLAKILEFNLSELSEQNVPRETEPNEVTPDQLEELKDCLNKLTLAVGRLAGLNEERTYAALAPGPSGKKKGSKVFEQQMDKGRKKGR